ncbi:MAG: PASTA domain-containing protein, partial [Clostridia bacterium]|nr:PASTA domain-containing protein [Clostridia bacterium]
QALEFSFKIGLISDREYTVLSEEVFTRGHMAAVSYNAMNCRLKDSEITLAASLVEAGAIDEATAVSENFLFNIPDWKRYLRYLEAGYFKPYVVGKDVDTALIELKKAGAINIEIAYSYNELVPVDHVISQDFPAYMDSGESFDCAIEVSIGPTFLNQLQLQELVEDKGWSDEVAPYIIAAAKFLIKETVLTRYDVMKRLEENINQVVLVDEEASAKMSFGAVYDSYTGNLYINKFIMDEELILHEITHAVSYSPGTGKLGFPVTGINTRAITEAFTYYTAAKIDGPSTGNLNVFYTGTEDIVFSGGEYNGDGRNNFILGVFAPLFTLADRQRIEKMYFL